MPNPKSNMVLEAESTRVVRMEKYYVQAHHIVLDRALDGP